MKRILTISAAFCFLFSALCFGQFNFSDLAFQPKPVAATSSSLNNGIVSYWKLDESSGDASDSVGGNTLTNINSTTYTPGKKSNGAVFVAASSQRLTRSSSASTTLNLTTAISICGWFTNNASDTMISKFISNTSGYMVDINANKVRTIFVNGTPSNVILSDSTTISSGTWYFFAVTWDGSTLAISVNGGAQTTTTLTAMTSPSGVDFNLGSRPAPSNFFGGKLDEVGIWNRALTTSEISELYNSGSGKTYPF